jgi:hypothetical protein
MAQGSLTFEVMNLPVQVSEGLLKHLGMARIAGGPDLLLNEEARKREAIDLALTFRLLRGEFHARALALLEGFGLLSLN